MILGCRVSGVGCRVSATVNEDLLRWLDAEGINDLGLQVGRFHLSRVVVCSQFLWEVCVCVLVGPG